MTGKKLKQARERFRLTLKQMAQLIINPHTGKHIDYRTLHRWEREEYQTPEYMQLVISQVLYNLVREHVELMPCPQCDGTGLVQRPIFQEGT